MKDELGMFTDRIPWMVERELIVRAAAKKAIRKRYRANDKKCPSNYEELHADEIEEKTQEEMRNWLFSDNMAIDKADGKQIWNETIEGYNQESVELLNEKEYETMGWQEQNVADMKEKVGDLNMPEEVAEVIREQPGFKEYVEKADSREEKLIELKKELKDLEDQIFG